MNAYINQLAVIGSVSYFSKKMRLLILVVIASFASPSFALMGQEHQGLDSIPNSHFDSFRVSENAKLPKSKRIFINDVSANFDKEWLVKFNKKTTKEYQEKVLQDYSQMLKQNIKAKLVSSGWDVMDSYEEGSIVMSAQLKNLYINGPEKLNRQHMLVKNIGKSSIEIVVNGADNQPIIIIEDKRNARGDSFFIEANNATNFSWFNRLTENWATVFVAYLDMTTSQITSKS